ncbi:complement C1q tumor necrosis factor-related protein 5 isoform X2 [Rhinatrema bivittatum]|uniref:complement C1q tumor necrosis factor-related protein 5 isoform X2 n=1 Tax=Rhinatrema bivittatum TaxID=194408 RepID=UPI00112E5E38|nr:complement C1q tumor necrosis factor-related protein 5 isoform X2 [Rhinatrema bivittatum]
MLMLGDCVLASGSCDWDEFLCDGRRCLPLALICDGFHNCADKTDEVNCNLKQRDLSLEVGHAIEMHFHIFSLESEDNCNFDFVEVHDSLGIGAPSLIGRFCGSQVPPVLTSSQHIMTVLFVADEDVSDKGFFASYRAWTFTNKTSCEPLQVQMCLGLSYNATSFPNLWLSIPDQQGAAELLKDYKTLLELPCYEYLRLLIYSFFVPPMHIRRGGGCCSPADPSV